MLRFMWTHRHMYVCVYKYFKYFRSGKLASLTYTEKKESEGELEEQQSKRAIRKEFEEIQSSVTPCAPY